MERATAIAFLERLHRAQGAFYAGGPADGVRALLAPDIEWHVPGGSPIAGRHYRLRESLLIECRLLPFDQAEFDTIWGAAA